MCQGVVLSERDSSHAMFLVFCVSFLFCIFSALFAHIYFTVVSRLSSVRSGRARSTERWGAILRTVLLRWY